MLKLHLQHQTFFENENNEKFIRMTNRSSVITNLFYIVIKNLIIEMLTAMLDAVLKFYEMHAMEVFRNLQPLKIQIIFLKTVEFKCLKTVKF